MKNKKPLLFLMLVVAGTSACNSPNPVKGLQFSMLPSASTGIDFNNQITEDDSLNMFVNEYTYMGGGVGAADFNKDGLTDLFFAGNQVSSRMYINKGNFKFEDITSKAGVSTTSWCTGVSIVDINYDGWPDVYVSVSGRKPFYKRKNLLFINQKDLSFKEEAEEFGLADSSYSTQAVFFDYDNDGRLDMYLANHTLDDTRPNDIREIKVDSLAIAADQLYHNEGVPAGMNHPLYKRANNEAGIREDGNGLGVVVSDFNNDGCPDIYVANDYIRNDLLWLNNKNGTFTNAIGSAIKHQSYSSMGTDAADINNDGLIDIVNLDMQPELNERKKMMYSFLNDQRYQLEMEKGYQPQFIRNMLQLNNGTRVVGNQQQPYFSEIGEMAGMAETDWSWSALIADLDNDGLKDIHIKNGLGRDPTNIDFLEYRHNTVVQTGIPDNDVAQRRGFIDHLASLGPVNLRNYIYRNKNGLQFEDVSMMGGIEAGSISTGAAYVDLDNDGNLDIVTNNVNGPAFIMRNDSKPLSQNSLVNHYLGISLQGDSFNTEGIGAKLYAYKGNLAQTLEQYPVRGYLSSVDPRLHFGFASPGIDSLKIIWANGKTQVISHPVLDSIINIRQGDAETELPRLSNNLSGLFADNTDQSGISFRHQETFFYDYAFQPLIQQKYSQEGPFISTGDLNGDGQEDFFIGGAFKQSGKVFLQVKDGRFIGHELVNGSKNEEDMQSVLIDVDGDHDLDLVVASGSSEFETHSSFYQPRLYLNDGKGNFKPDSAAFPALVRTAGKCLAAADIDGDGDLDLFLGGRIALGTFPFAPRSYLLRNDKGKFTDITRTYCPALENVGLLNAAVWQDMDNDKIPDLIIAGDWMPIRVFKNTGNSMKGITQTTGLDSLPGFWRSLAVKDVDGDGDLDIIAGNIGLNNPFHIMAKQPAELVAKDFDGNGVTEPIFCYYIKDNEGTYKLSAGISRDEWATQMPMIKKRYDQNGLYAKASMENLFDASMRAGAATYQVKEVRSGYFENDGKGAFHFHPFDTRAQMAPVNAILFQDFNGDGKEDLLLAGNDYEWGVSVGRLDASFGWLLTGEGKGQFKVLTGTESGLFLDGDIRDLKIINSLGQGSVVCGINNANMKILRLQTRHE